MARAQAGSSGGGANYTAKNKIKNLGKRDAVKKTTASIKKVTAVSKATKAAKKGYKKPSYRTPNG